MRRKIVFIFVLTTAMTLLFNTAVFAAVPDVGLPSKLSDIIDLFLNTSAVRPDDITLTLYGQTLTIIDFSYVEEHLDTIHWIIRAITYPSLILFSFDKLVTLLSGAAFSNAVSVFVPAPEHRSIGFRND